MYIIDFHPPAKNTGLVVVTTEGTAAPVLETRAHERGSDEEHGYACDDGREDLAQGLHNKKKQSRTQRAALLLLLSRMVVTSKIIQVFMFVCGAYQSTIINSEQ